jgi:uncharacterized protein
MELLRKYIEFTIDQKSFTPEAIKSRIISGYASTWDLDMAGDKILPGAFQRSINLRFATPMKEKNKSRIRFLYQHDRPIGIIKEIREDAKGLYVECYISRIKLGDELLTLLHDGAIDCMSIGYIVPEGGAEEVNGIRELKEIDLYEVSIVVFPMNESTEIFNVRGFTATDAEPKRVVDLTMQSSESWHVSGNRGLALADKASWDGSGASKRVFAWANGDWAKYRQAFIVSNSAAKDTKGGYKLPFADIVDGSLKAIPGGIEAAMAALHGSRGGVSLPENVKSSAIAFCAAYYKKMGKDVPQKEKEAQLVDFELKELLYRVDQINNEVKAGKKLSAANQRKLLQAASHIHEVLSACMAATPAGEMEPDSDDPADLKPNGKNCKEGEGIEEKSSDSSEPNKEGVNDPIRMENPAAPQTSPLVETHGGEDYNFSSTVDFSSLLAEITPGQNNKPNSSSTKEEITPGQNNTIDNTDLAEYLAEIARNFGKIK